MSSSRTDVQFFAIFTSINLSAAAELGCAIFTGLFALLSKLLALHQPSGAPLIPVISSTPENVNSPPPALADSTYVETFDYAKRTQWLRAASLGANDGLVTVASLMLGVGAVNQTATAMVMSGLAALFAGAFKMAISKYVSVYPQVDIEIAQKKRKKRYADVESSPEKEEKEKLPSPLLVAGVSAVAFAIGGVLPLLAGAFISQHWVRIGVVSGVSTLALALLGWAGAFLGGSPIYRSTVRVLVGGLAAMLVSFGLPKLFGLAFKVKMDISE